MKYEKKIFKYKMPNILIICAALTLVLLISSIGCPLGIAYFSKQEKEFTQQIQMINEKKEYESIYKESDHHKHVVNMTEYNYSVLGVKSHFKELLENKKFKILSLQSSAEKNGPMENKNWRVIKYKIEGDFLSYMELWSSLPQQLPYTILHVEEIKKEDRTLIFQGTLQYPMKKTN